MNQNLTGPLNSKKFKNFKGNFSSILFLKITENIVEY